MLGYIIAYLAFFFLVGCARQVEPPPQPECPPGYAVAPGEAAVPECKITDPNLAPNGNGEELVVPQPVKVKRHQGHSR